ncbi:MAG TPA: CHAT domain-containing protein [Planctomycetota bacterium]|nr:CHAT domain-containing protein [Planctomycetota bacterium]
MPLRARHRQQAGGGSLVRPALIIVFLAATRAKAADMDRLEALGDAEWKRAVPFYQASLYAWERVAALSTKLEDSFLAERSLSARASLALLLRSTRILEGLRREARSPAWRDCPVSPPPLIVPAAGGSSPPPLPALERLARFLNAAQRRYAAVSGREERDLVILAETAALVERSRGDIHQALADISYRDALREAEARGASPRLASRRVRLLYKLRDFVRASDAAAAIPSTDQGSLAGAGLTCEEEAEPIALLRDIALFGGDFPRARRLGDDLRRLGSKEEEAARPGARFPSLAIGSTVDLADTAQTLVAMLAGLRLSPREAAIVSLLVADAAVELGEHALAEEVLAAAHPGPAGAGAVTPGGAANHGALDPWLDASILARLGAARSHLGDYEAALHSLEAARRVSSPLRGTEVFGARVAVNLSRTLIALGQIDRGRQEAASVLSGERLPPDLRIRARILVGNAVYEGARESPKLLADARAAFQAALRELTAAQEKAPGLEGGPELEATIHINLANILRLEALALGEDDAAARRREAILLQDKALGIADRAKLWPLAAVASANLGELYLEARDLATARAFVEWAMARALDYRLFETEWRCHWYRGRIADLDGDSAAADASYTRAAALVESYRSRILDAETKSGFLTDKMTLYRDIVRRELERGRVPEALAAAEKAKARALLDSLGWRFITLSDPRETELYREFVLMVARSEKARDGGAGSLLGVRARPASYDELRARLSDLKERIRSRETASPALRALVDGDPSDAPSILRDLPRGIALVEYFSLGRSFVALIAEDGRVDAVPLPVAPSDLEPLALSYVRGGAADPAAARRLFSLLVAPVLPRVKASRVVIVPYGVLHQVPFETLRDDKGYLLQRWEIAYLPSASILKFLKHKRVQSAGRGRKSLRLLAVVDPDTDYDRDGVPDLAPLLHARAEVAALSLGFGAMDLLVGAEAVKALCQERASGYDVLHYACHGEFCPPRPWDSSLFLASGTVGGKMVDGRLRASEIYALDLRRSQLVALSACETGKSQVRPGDDTVSLGTAFLHAGASALLVSLWKVEDEATSALMKAFYGKWIREGKEKGRALREAKLELMAGSFPHPRQWGAFVLLGEP